MPATSPEKNQEPQKHAVWQERLRQMVRWRFFLVLAGLLLLLLNQPRLSAFSPLWDRAEVRTNKPIVFEPGIYRVPQPVLKKAVSLNDLLVVISSKWKLYTFCSSTAELRNANAPAFAMTDKSLRIKPADRGVEEVKKARLWFARHRLSEGGWVLCNKIALAFVVLPLLPYQAFGAFLARQQLRPVAPDDRAGKHIDDMVELILSRATVLAGIILVLGYGLSWVNLLNSTPAWVFGLLASLAVWVAILRRGRKEARGLEGDTIPDVSVWSVVKEEFRSARWSGALCLFLVAVLVMVQAAQVVVAFGLPSTNHDSLTYILPRLAYFLQQGSVDFFKSNYIAMTVHPKSGAVFQIFAYLISGRTETAIHAVSLVGSWISLLSVFGVARILCGRILPSLAAASLAGLTANFITIAVTPQLDMPITALAALAIYFMTRWTDSPSRLSLLAYAVVSISMACGIKASALVLVPSLGCVAAGCWWWQTSAVRQKPLAPAVVCLSSLLGGILLFVLPAGYVDNSQRYGHYMGSQYWRSQVVMPPLPLGEQVKEAARNAGRYAVHFIGLDGLPFSPRMQELQSSLREPVLDLFRRAGLDLTEITRGRQPFKPEVFGNANEDMSYAGPSFLLLLLPGAFFALVKLPRRRLAAYMILGAMCYVAAQSWSSRYDPWRGRSFANLTLFLSPLSALLFCPDVSRGWKVTKVAGQLTLAACCGVAAFAGLCGAFSRQTSPLVKTDGTIAFEGSIFDQNHLWHLCRSDLRYYDFFRRFDEVIPQNASILLYGVRSDFQYPLAGQNMSRRVIYDLQQGSAEYLVYGEDTLEMAEGDVFIEGPKVWFGKPTHLYVRKMGALDPSLVLPELPTESAN